ncbi:unnamed protein product [Dracunculus medinensis]|uniref:Uncharacterized protein n=1 Tax=Dracunculus medinensis TaxID=318479 RepID=A0A0N4U7J2_DRAME|nr:unnamed protein product [Dracunculus medinensis]
MSEEIVFKKRKLKQRNLRKINDDSVGDEEDLEIISKLEAVKELQESRLRSNGLNAVECALGKELAAEFLLMNDDPFRQRGGGMLRLSDDRQAQMNAANIEADIRDQFKKETFLRDEHKELQKYIQNELKKRKAEYDFVESPESSSVKSQSIEDKLFFKAAEKIRSFRSERNDELLSNQMLAGIPEVDLGINARMNNIIETEKKKNEMLNEAMGKRRRLMTEEDKS